MQPSEEDQGQSVVLGSHSGLGFVAVHVGKVLKSLRQQQNFVHAAVDLLSNNTILFARLIRIQHLT